MQNSIFFNLKTPVDSAQVEMGISRYESSDSEVNYLIFNSQQH